VDLAGDAEVLAAVRTHEAFLRTETLAESVTYLTADEPGDTHATVGDGAAIGVVVHRI